MHYEKGKCIHSKFDRYVFDYYKMYGLGFNVIGGGNRSIRRKPDQPQVIDKRFHIMLYRVHLAMRRIRNKNV